MGYSMHTCTGISVSIWRCDRGSDIDSSEAEHDEGDEVELHGKYPVDSEFP